MYCTSMVLDVWTWHLLAASWPRWILRAGGSNIPRGSGLIWLQVAEAYMYVCCTVGGHAGKFRPTVRSASASKEAVQEPAGQAGSTRPPMYTLLEGAPSQLCRRTGKPFCAVPCPRAAHRHRRRARDEEVGAGKCLGDRATALVGWPADARRLSAAWRSAYACPCLPPRIHNSRGREDMERPRPRRHRASRRKTFFKKRHSSKEDIIGN